MGGGGVASGTWNMGDVWTLAVFAWQWDTGNPPHNLCPLVWGSHAAYQSPRRTMISRGTPSTGEG